MASISSMLSIDTRAPRTAAELRNPVVYHAHHLRIWRMPFVGPKKSTSSSA